MANNTLRSLKKLDPKVKFISPEKAPSPRACIIQSFADASTGSSAYGQTGLITGILLPRGDGSEETLFHPLLWHSSKQSRVSFSSVGAEILAAADAADRSLHVRECLATILQNKRCLPDPPFSRLIWVILDDNNSTRRPWLSSQTHGRSLERFIRRERACHHPMDPWQEQRRRCTNKGQTPYLYTA